MMFLRSIAPQIFIGILLFVCSSFLIGAVFNPSFTNAQSVEDIRSQIADHNQQIEALEKEIAGYQKELNALGSTKQTLQTSISSLDTSRAKLTAQIKATQKKIDAQNLILKDLGGQIADKAESISVEQSALADAIRKISISDDTSLMEQLFSSDSLTDAWTAADQLASFNVAIRDHSINLAAIREALMDQESQVSESQKKLGALTSDLSGQRGSLDATKAAKTQLLNQTKAQESSYQALIAQKRAQQKAFESALSDLENSLQIAIDPSKIAAVGKGVLSWPISATTLANCQTKKAALGNPFCITQYFGNTPFSTANSQIYNGNGHNAIDIGIPTGTSLLAALGGTVTGTGNTDAIPGCYSYGKWVLIKHANGLSTLYAHLSSISVSPGEAVSTGQIIGYSGMTGYATGPHLHFGVYATEGTQILTLAQYRGATSPCANARMPVAPKDAYLNPMSFL